MEDIANSYHFVLVLKEDILSGMSIRQCIRSYVDLWPNDFSKVLLKWLVSLENGTLESFYQTHSSISSFEKALFHLLEQANKGASILNSLEGLEQEMKTASLLQIDEHLGKLPYKLIVPLLLFQFPALLLLILGPLLLHLIKEI